VRNAVEWLNSNQYRSFPIQEDCGHQASSLGTLLVGVLLPNYVLVDANFTIAGDLGVRIYLSQLVYTGDLLSLVFAASDGTIFTTLAVPSVSGSTSPTPYFVTGLGPWTDCRGFVVIGDLSRLPQDLPQGIYSFTVDQTMLEARCTRPAIRGVQSLSVTNQGTQSLPLRGDINLIAGANVQFRYDAYNNAIWIDVVPNAGYQEECACDQVGIQNNVVKTINGIAIEDVIIDGDGECVQVVTTGNTITISDLCSKPCCGCPELDFLNQTIDVINSSLQRLEQYTQQLNERITAFTTNYILTVGI